MQNNIPNYADLFGNIDFKEGDDARSVYSPAAYLTDLLQMLDDEFDDATVSFDTRRSGIKDIELDAENTNTLIPYLDIVNEVLEEQVTGGISALKSAAYPFNMPFSLDNEKIKNHLHHLSISAHELRRLFATDTDYYTTVAREYLGLSLEEWQALLEPETLDGNTVKSAYGTDTTDTDNSFIKDMSTVATFMETTDLTAQEILQLLYHNLYIEPSNHSNVEAGRHNFYINTGIDSSSGYVTLNTEEITLVDSAGTWLVYPEETPLPEGETGEVYTEETALVWYDYDSETDTQTNISTVPIQWFERTSRFVRLAQKTGLSFTDLDHILRHCCEVDGTPTLNEDTLQYIAQVVYLHKTLEQPIDKVVAVVSEIDFTGRTNEDLPQDQFNRIFNLPCVSVNEKYLHITSVMGKVPEQYNDQTYHTYTKIDYNPDLFSDENDDYRKRLRHSLGFTDTDLINITNRLEYEEVADSSLWEEIENEWQLLNVLYRIRALCDGLDVHFLELFTLFDLLEQDPFINRSDPHTYFVYNRPSTHKCFEIFMAGVNSSNNTSDQLWLFESLVVLTKWMKEFGYSPEMLWKIVNGAPMTDKEEVQQQEQDLALYNNLLQSFKAGEISPNTLTEVLGDERASHFAFSLIKAHYGDKHEYKPKRCRKSSRFRKHMAPKEHKHFLLAYKPREIEELAHDFIQQLGTISDYEFIDLQLENKLIEKIFNNLVNHKIIDGSGKILTENFIDHQLPSIAEFEIEYDFSDFNQQVFELFYRIYQEAADARIEESDTIEVQVFKSDLKELGLTETEARELYDNLIYNGYIDSEGYAQDVSMFSDPSGASSFDLTTELGELTRPVYHLLKKQLSKFKASKVKISEQIFAELDLKPVALQDLIENLKMNRYIDEHMFVRDKMRIVGESPRTMALALQFYPHRQEILKALKNAIAAEKDSWLKIDRVELGKIAATAVSRWVYEDLQDSYLDGKVLQSGAGAFFKEESNRENFSLRQYFDVSQTTIIFDHIVGIINYADNYRLKDENLADLDFKAEEIRGLKQVLQEINVIDDNGILLADWLPFFLVPENAATFSVPGFEDYDKEIFFQLYDIAKAVDGTVMAVDKAMKEHSDAQENGILEQLQSVLGIESSAVKAVSKAVFKTDNNLHFPWLQPLLENANALGSLDEIPDDMHYTQAVKRIRQLALLINKEQLDINEIAILLEDQDLVAKFPEDMILPDDITSVDAILESEEFIYLFKKDYYWIYLAQDYTLIDKKELVPDIDEDYDLIDLQKEDEELQKRLKEDPIRQLFDKEQLSQVDAAFIDRYGTWVVVSEDSHYVKYAHTDVWDKRSNQFGQVDNDFDNLEMIDAAYVDSEGRLFLFANDKYVRYSDVNFTLDYNNGSNNPVQPKVDWGYPKSIAEDWNDENLPIQLPKAFSRDLGPMFDGLDNYSYAFLGEEYISSEDGTVRPVAQKWGHREYNFGQTDHIDAAMVNQEGNYLFFLDDKVVKYAGSIELANLQPEEGYPKPLHQEFTSLPDEFVLGIDAALNGVDGGTYLFRDDEFVSIDPNATIEVQETRSKWGIVTNQIATVGMVDAAFVGLDGYTYMFSGEQYVRYSGSDYSQVDDGFPRNISEDWEGLTEVTGAFVLDNRTYLFGKNNQNTNIYVRYSTLPKDEEDYLEVDEEDPNARVIETVLANRPDVDEIEVFPATVDDEFWSLPESITGGASDFQIDAVMNGPDGKVYLFYGDQYVEHDYANRWWSEPKILSGQWNRTITGLEEGDHIVAAFTGKDGKTYLFYNSKYLRFSDPELRRLDYGYPRLTKKFWGKVRNNIDKTGKVDAALVVESRWEEQDDNGQLVDRTARHTYLFSGDQIFRYQEDDYRAVEPGYPRSINRLHEEPRFRGLQIGFGNEHRDYSNGKQRHRKLPFKGLHASFPKGIDAAFADQRQVYLFKGNSFHVVIGDEDNYKQYTDSNFANIQAVTQEKGVSYVLSSSNNTWQKFNHLEATTLTPTEATPRTAEKAAGKLKDDNQVEIPIDAILHGTDGKSYVFGGDQYYDVELERSFAIANVWGRSRNPIYDQETIDAAFVGRDGVTYVFSGEWFVEYDSTTSSYINQNVTYPPRRIRDKWRDLDNVALAYVWKEETYLFERPKADGSFRYLRYSKDSYERPDPGYPREGDYSQWNIPEEHQREGFDNIDTIFVQEDNLIFISDQKFISFNLNTENWSYPQPLELIYSGIPFNKTDFQDLKSGFIGADGTAYFFNQQCYVSYDSTNGWSNVSYIKDHWGLQNNILSNSVSAAWVSGDGVTYLFAGNSYVRYSGPDYRYVDEAYPKEIATYLRSEPAFEFMSKEFQQHLDELEETYSTSTTSFDFFNGVLDNGRCLYFFTSDTTSDTLFTGSPNRYVAYEIAGIGHIENNFTQGGYVDAAFVDTQNAKTYLFSGEQYICYTGDRYRYIDEGYPKIIAESLAEDLGIASLGEDYRNGIDAAFYHNDLGLVLFNEQKYLNVTDDGTSTSTEGDVNVVWGELDNAFTSVNSNSNINGAYVDNHGALYVFKDEQFVRYSDTAELFDLNRYDEPRYVDEEYPRKIEEIWPQLDSSILTTNVGVDTVFKFEDQIYFHNTNNTTNNFVTYNLDLTDQYEQKPVQLLAYRWGEWSDYLLSDVHTISRFKNLGQRFMGGELTLTELVSGATGKVKEPYMHFAAIFGFEKEEVRWVKQRNAFLPEQVNAIEEDFDLELVLRLYDILATTQRLRVDVSALYNDVWLPLYDPNYWSEEKPDVVTAATGAYDLLVSVDCDNNYETLVKQITNELNTIKRDALVPYIIANDIDVTTTRQLYQKLLIDIQMDSSAETSRIKEATAAIQLYLHRYFLNLEDIDLNTSDQEATRLELKERWEWLRNYRVWEANRKVFLYPENYIRPELRDSDMKTSGFKALEASLSQGQLTETSIEEAYLEYLNNFTEVSQLKIAGGYVYEDSSPEINDKKLVLFGHTRTNPRRYFYRFATFVGGESAAAIWEPWEELDIKIEATRVEPVFAFNRVFVFWTVLEENTEDPSSGTITTTGESPEQEVSSSGNTYQEVKVYYSFYNLNKRWTQPQLLQTTFEGSELKQFDDFNTSRTLYMFGLKVTTHISKVGLFVENSTKLSQNGADHDNYENIYISVRFYVNLTLSKESLGREIYEQESGPHYKAFNLTRELYSQEAEALMFEDQGQELFKELFEEGEIEIEEDNVVMLNNSSNSTDGPWFAYNHKGCGFLVKPDAISLDSDKELTTGVSDLPGLSDPNISLQGDTTITAAVQVSDGGDTYYFLSDKTYVKVSADDTVSIPAAINSRWGIPHDTSKMQITGHVDSAYVIGNQIYLRLDGELYQYTDSFSTLVTSYDEPADMPGGWSSIDAAFTNKNSVKFWFNNELGLVYRSDTGSITPIRTTFGLPQDNTGIFFSSVTTAVVYNGNLHWIDNTNYYEYYPGAQEPSSTLSNTVQTVLDSILGTAINFQNTTLDSQTQDALKGYTLAAIMTLDDGGLATLDDQGNRIYVDKNNVVLPDTPSPFNVSGDDENWTSGLNYTDTNGNSYYLAFYSTHSGITTNKKRLVKAWIKDGNGSDYLEIIFDLDRTVDKEDKLYDTNVNVTGAFTTAGGYIVIITDQTTYHLFDNSLQPADIITKLGDDTYSGNLSDLNLAVYLNTTFNNVWLNNKVDAAFIGTGALGDPDALYLFCDNQCLCFSQQLDGSFSSSADYYETLDTNTKGFPTQWSQIDAAFTSPDGISYLFNNDLELYYDSNTSATNTTVGVWGVRPVNKLLTEQQVDAAYVFGNYLYLIVNTDSGTEYYRYTLGSSANNGVWDTVPDYIDDEYPKTYAETNSNIDAAFVINNYVYLFSGTEYYRLEPNDPTELGSASKILGSWGNLPSEIRNPEGDNPSALSAALNHVDGNIETLYLIKGDAYINYEMSNADLAQPYEIKDVNYELIRLTSSTAEQLNQLLFADGIDELLKLSTQEINESPTLTIDGESTPENIKMNSAKFSTEPINSHLDFNSANGIYYWEVFFHAPFLIAQTLNTEQQFEYAKQWYEYIFDPTEISDYWKFLPFLAADPDALMASLSYDMDEFVTLFKEGTVNVNEVDGVSESEVKSTVSTASSAVQNMETVLAPFQEVFLGLVNQDLYEESSGKNLATIESWQEFSQLNTVISNLSSYLSNGNITASTTSDSELLNTWVSGMQEVMEILKKLDFRIDLMSNYNAQLTVYLEDPFDPHAIAALRPLAYRKAIVMRYIDNLLDWGDMLFRQYTRESINEARMLYILAYDILGEEPENMGRVVLEPTQSYNGFYTDENGTQVNPSEAYDFLIDLENSSIDGMLDRQSLSFAATQFDTIDRPYFFIKENELFTEYWTRVEDRLGKIRASLNIDGVAQPLPLFQPPIDPMALVNAAASGGGITAAAMAAAGAASVPDYRFSSMMAKARDLVGKLKSFSDNLLSVLEKKDSEELSLMQNKQSAMILDIVTSLKKEQIEEAKESLANLKETKNSAIAQKNHYQNLISKGHLREEKHQINLMWTAAGMHSAISLSQIASGLSYVGPQVTLGAFSFGATAGGKNVGDMMSRFGDAIQTSAEGLSMFGEALGVEAQFKRSKQDWELQKKMAASEMLQLDYQIAAQEHRVKMSEIELFQHEKEIENEEIIAKFMKSKFSNMQLYSWMKSKISGLFFQTFKLAHDYAKKAEQAFIFEKGIKAGEVNYINGMYWENQYQGLLSGSTLELDLDRMEKAYAEMDSRRLEITKNISLLEIDPLALLQLKTKGSCTFRLSEELFDYDFPGHYNRQIKAVSLAFNVGEGQKVNATLTQLSSKLVMDTDIKAVKHLMNPANEATTNVRANWRANQQVALSHVDQYTENSGMFELNFGDERYLPFEGTGAVSNWNLEINGKKGDYNPNDLLDVTIKLRYTAKQGGSRFANEVKGVLKPYNATSFFDLAYNFTDEWAALTGGETNDMSITFTQDMFPNMSSSKIIGLLIRYEYNNGQGGAFFTINDNLQVPNNTYLQPTTLSIGQRGSEWKFTVKGDASSLQNAEMVLVYKAKI
ncbi:hemopexin repeat-containing protein [Moorena sp. SIO3B2]|uniref:Tc toxin subunit A-related protein n=1 Tax=Moorena sp. SIO3B2 TaxID=2607827 RepID=UPI00257BCA10|nr:hemopexin repeat-containing protein [Moorena sp. SIO3B2]